MRVGRRHFIAAMTAVLAAILPAQAVANRPPRPTWVRLRGSDGDYSISVDDLEVDLAGLDAAVLRRAMAAHPSMSEEAVRRDVRIYIMAERDLRYRVVLEVMRHMRFEKVGIVAEDRRN